MRSEAQKRADKKYFASHPVNGALFQARLKSEEVAEIEQILDACGMTKVAFVRWAAAELKRQTQK